MTSPTPAAPTLMPIHDHELKAWPDVFQEMVTGRKLFEFRKDDRGFAIGHVLWIREWEQAEEKYTGRSMTVQVSYILRGMFGVPQDYCVMSFDMGSLVPRSSIDPAALSPERILAMIAVCGALTDIVERPTMGQLIGLDQYHAAKGALAALRGVTG